jgi:hypothetical protein
MPKPTGPSREEIKARIRAKVEAEKALPASEQIANTLHAVRTTAEAQQLLNAFRAEVLREAAAMAEDFASGPIEDIALGAFAAHLRQTARGGAR